jgi:streptogramin lyase
VPLAEQVAAALDAAHRRGLVHRDVKPSNVLVAGGDHVYLADFGLTRRLGEPGAAVGAAQSLGTADYVAPEQICGDEIDGRADLYSLACLLHECLTGEPPFKRASEAATLFAHLEEAPPAPPGLAGVMRMGLAKQPDERYQSGRELVEAARAALGLEPRRVRWPLAASAVGLALIGAAVAGYLLSAGGTSAPRSSGRVVQIDPVANRVVRATDVGQTPTAIAAGPDGVWLASSGDSAVRRLDPVTLRTVWTVPVEKPTRVVVSGGVVDVASGVIIGTNVMRLDAASGARLDAVPVQGIAAIAAGTSGVWIGAADVERVSAGTAPGRITAHVLIPDPAPLDATHVRFNFESLAVGEEAIWVVGDALDPRLWRIDPRTGRVIQTLRLPFAPRAVAAGAGAVWVTAELDDVVARIDPASNRIVATIRVGRLPSAVAAGAGAVWVANTLDDTDRSSNRPRRGDDSAGSEPVEPRRRRGTPLGGGRCELTPPTRAPPRQSSAGLCSWPCHAAGRTQGRSGSG